MWNVLRFKNIVRYKFKKSHYINNIDLKKKLLLIYLTYGHKKQAQVINNWRKTFIKEDEKPIDFVNILDWEMNSVHLHFNMSVFNSNYVYIDNKSFFNYFGILYYDKWDTEKDLIFYNDPYRLY